MSSHAPILLVSDTLTHNNSLVAAPVLGQGYSCCDKVGAKVTGISARRARASSNETVTHSSLRVRARPTHTNTIEGFWCLLKRGRVDSYHKVSKDYLPLY